VAACGKNAKTSASANVVGDSAASSEAVTGGDAQGMDPREAEQWSQAEQGDPEELMRLADLAGCAGLEERAAQPALRPIAIRAMQYCRDFSELPWLAQGTEGSDADARAALESVVELAAMPRRATDPEDADELHDGCARLLSLARATDRPRDRRVLAIRALRMLGDRGCVKRDDVPVDLDAK
jgi:hypothetical protein